MIVEPTVLVLGAGASIDFGFPSGFELLSQISGTSDIMDYRNPILEKLHGRMLAQEFRQFSASLRVSGKLSVDAYLEHREEFMDAGKLAIAYALLHCESENALFASQDGGPNWYQYLYNKLNAREEDFEQNKLSVITFNYDQSLEHFLYVALTNSYGLPGGEANRPLRTVPIVHVHGTLGPLDWKEPGGRTYGDEVRDNNLNTATESIRVVHEPQVEGDPIFLDARALLERANRVCFLGFGYHEDNVRRLGIPEIFKDGAAMLGSAFGLKDGERREVDRLFEQRIYLVNSNWDNLTVIRETGILNPAPLSLAPEYRVALDQ